MSPVNAEAGPSRRANGSNGVRAGVAHEDGDQDLRADEEQEDEGPEDLHGLTIDTFVEKPVTGVGYVIHKVCR
jgi:hypothetical protein